MTNIDRARNDMALLHPQLFQRESIIAIGTWVALQNDLGEWLVGTVMGYGISPYMDEELRGVCRYTIQGWETGRFLRLESELHTIDGLGA